jgi:Spondin_N
MKRLWFTFGLCTMAVTALMTGGTARGQESDSSSSAGQHFAVTVTNLTRGQTFTPVLVASHKAGVRLFTPGSAARPELATLAEEGDVGPLTNRLLESRAVHDVVNSGAPPGGFVLPGQSKTILVRTRGQFDHISLAAMLIPTNDGFFALNGVAGPTGHRRLTLFSPAYDAGSERNDELCASIPGPFFVECGGPGGGARVGNGEGYVHIHAGIHGIGDMNEAERDWRNPVAQISIRRTR